jgi:hypothetical protein
MNDDRTLTDPAGADDGDEWLDRLLVADAVEHRAAYVADDGFTARVMAALPAPCTLPAWRKPAIVGLWGVAAAVLAVAMPGAMLDVGREAYRLLATQPVSLSGIAGAAVAMIGFTWAAAAYTLRLND